ncbi:uncharacterized protein BDCG_16636 [Blastomyces dermatitidis ER-3]|uniref:Uncharacterized protein n=2 Tax=Ajellomyces dermatitidis TaxID=5039 RepID=A0A0J9EKN6_AJEDA|nr:uncharacterized protein BDCG_16636 [Blastomyces dermatitidis ER-3]EQL32179.1 hypothetical protein BDFG_05558 [Blastomyces dermatitidis ATCC 26199]KMW66933.1 hypothetical protein BDDG_11802 [Blastomyces dermatitidis ATCC 18188]OAT00488.1 hypothetical protein BDCG_16636 [Blastomyces dermatitidis ER-3]
MERGQERLGEDEDEDEGDGDGEGRVAKRQKKQTKLEKRRTLMKVRKKGRGKKVQALLGVSVSSVGSE